MNRQNLFGQIIHNTMRLNTFGKIVESVWKGIPLYYNEVNNDVFVVMPNHIHGIITFQDGRRADSKSAPTHSLSEVVRAFKAYSSRGVNELRNSQGTSIWQRNYYEHVIRNETDYCEIGEYILGNPVKWDLDRENLLQPKKEKTPPFEY
jgi:putative transposase